MLTKTKSQNTMDINSEQSPLNGGMNAKKKDNLSYSNEPIEGTPFRLISSENGYIIVLGDYRVTEIKNTKEEALEMLYSWEFKINVISAIIKINEKIAQLTEN